MALHQEKHLATQLRLEGHSYGEIRQALGIPKSTLSVWFKGLRLSPRALRVLEPKQRKGLLALAEFNRQRTISIKKENVSILEGLKSRVGKLSDRDLMLVGAALYWGEGYKNFKKGTYEHINFANSDPDMIRVFLVFLERILGIKRVDLKGHVFIYPRMEPEGAVAYWRRVTKIPTDNFHVYKAVSRASKQKRSKNLLPHGTLQVRLIKRREFFKIRGIIDGIVEAVA